ncbi:MAG TPA: hypothetical protein VHB30_14225, partial [Solirubrobacteraceae bacterium]|nr:hypothetical protein [Solirubrobacteraceae bacterium]
AWLAGRHDAGELPAVERGRRIERDRRTAYRGGLAGPMGERVAALLDELEPVAGPLGCARGVDAARDLLRRGGGAADQRAAAGRPSDLERAVRALSARFGDPALG